MKTFKYNDPELKPVGTIEEAQEHILSTYKPLKILKYELPAEATLSSFLFNLFPTLALHESEDTTDGTVKLKRRSLVDIFLLCRTYFPECSLKEVKDILISNPDIRTTRCHNVHRRVYWTMTEFVGRIGYTVYDEYKPATVRCEHLDEFGISFQTLKTL